MIRSLCALLLSLNLSLLFAQGHFTKTQVLEDIDYLKASLEEAHHDLYAYTTKEEFDKNYRAVRKTINNDSIGLLEATSFVQKVISKANNCHTGIEFPGSSYGQYAYSGGTVFPLEIAFENGKSFIRKNWSGNDSIKIGSTILSINGMSISSICEKMYPHISAERPYFKKAKIEIYSFPRLYWKVFGKQDDFEVEIMLDGKSTTYQLEAINLIEGYEQKRTEVLNAQMKLAFYDDAAYLNPGHFSGDFEQYKHFIDSAFNKILENKPANLIMDLRNNGGGDDAFSDYMVSYFANKPFYWTSDFTLKTSAFLKDQVRKRNDTTAHYWQQILAHDDGEVYSYEFDAYQPQSEEKRFKGQVYTLANRQSHSQSAVTAAQIQDYGFGIIVGEETGDYPSLYASQFQYTLPNTGITVNVSKGFITRVNGSKAQEGVIPDIYIKDHLLDEKDEILEGLLKKLASEGK